MSRWKAVLYNIAIVVVLYKVGFRYGVPLFLYYKVGLRYGVYSFRTTYGSVLEALQVNHYSVQIFIPFAVPDIL